MLTTTASVMSLVVPPKEGVVLLVVVPPGEVFIVRAGPATADPTGPATSATRTTSTARMAPKRPLRALIGDAASTTVSPPVDRTFVGPLTGSHSSRRRFRRPP